MILALMVYMICYLTYCTIKKGQILESFSSTAYIVKSKYIYILTFLAIACVTSLPLSTINVPLCVMFVIGVVLVGMSPTYKSVNRYLHYTGGILAGISSQILVGIINPWLLLSWIPLIIYFLIDKRDDKVFWAEVICMITLMIILL